MTNREMDRELLDDAARAAWLYYVDGRTQDEIAKVLGVSRQRAQRLVSKAVADGLIRVQVEHPITELMDIASRLRDKYGLERARIAPDLGVDGNLKSVAPFAARLLEGILANPEPRIVGFGTGRALRAMIEQMTKMSCPQHKLVSVIGNIAPDGAATIYEVLMRLTDYVDAPHFPLPMPVLAASEDEAKIYRNLASVQKIYQMADQMDTAFVGVGQLDSTAPIMLDGFISDADRTLFLTEGVIGEVCGHPFNQAGEYVESDHTRKLTSYKVHASDDLMVIGIAAGRSKVEPIRAALKGNILSGLVTDEPTARTLLA